MPFLSFQSRVDQNWLAEFEKVDVYCVCMVYVYVNQLGYYVVVNGELDCYDHGVCSLELVLYNCF